MIHWTVKSPSHITADGQAVSHSWCCTPPRAHEKFLKLKYDTVLKGRIQGGSIRKTTQLMLYGEIMAIYCENHIEDISTLCGQGAEFLLLSLVIGCSIPRKPHFFTAALATAAVWTGALSWSRRTPRLSIPRLLSLIASRNLCRIEA